MIEAVLLHAHRTDTREFKAWTNWMRAAADLSGRYSKAVKGDDPFAYNETASVSILAAAAACAGYVGLAEFSTAKLREGHEKPGRGRSDFWMKAEGRSWAFEFKQWNPYRPPAKRLVSHMDQARRCALEITEDDADRSVAGLIMSSFHIQKGVKFSRSENRKRATEKVEAFKKDCDYVWELRPANTSPSTFLMFKVVKEWD